MNVWVCRAGKDSIYYPRFLENNRVFLCWDGWDRDLCSLPDNKEELRELVASECQDTSKTAISNHLSQLLIFRDRMSIGDWVLVPGKRSRFYSIATIVSDYVFSESEREHFKHQRKVEWLLHDVPRDYFSKSLQYSLGAYRTVFAVKCVDEIENCVKNQCIFS